MTTYRFKNPAPRGEYTTIRACVADTNPDPEQWAMSEDHIIEGLTKLYVETINGGDVAYYGHL